jgi:hypothetical protein
MHGSAERAGTDIRQPLCKSGFTYAIRAGDDDGVSGWSGDPAHDACDRSRGKKAGSRGVAETPPKDLHPGEAPNGRIRRSSALDCVGELSADVSAEGLVEAIDERRGLLRGEGSDVLPFTRVGDSLSQALGRQINGANGVELGLVGAQDGLCRNGIESDAVRIIERVEFDDVAAALDDPVRRRDVVAKALKKPEGNRQAQWPERIEVVHGAVHVAAAPLAVRAFTRSVKNTGGRPEEGQDLV